MRPGILFTGGSGLLAVNWAMSLRDRYRVILLLHERIIEIPGTETIQIQLSDIQALKQLLVEKEIGTVVHCAAITNIETCEAKPILAKQINTELSESLAMACRSASVQFVQISTDQLFDGTRSLADELTPVQPLNVYGKTKAEAEQRVLRVDNRFLVIRTNFYGWGTAYRASFSDWIIHQLRSGQPVHLFEDVFYTPVVIPELTGTVMQLLEKNAGGIFAVTGNRRISKYAFGVLLARKFSLPEELIIRSRFTDRKDLVQRPADLSLSNQKVSNLLGREVGVIEEGIEALFQQEQSGYAQKLKNIVC
jgi:dTDP-4-dehydrorhamnose reductase